MGFDISLGNQCLRPPADPAEWAIYFAIQSTMLFAGGPVPPPRVDRRGDPYVPLLFLVDGRIVGTLVIDVLNPDDIAFRRVAIAQSEQGKGLGAALMDLGERLAARMGARRALLHAKANALGFYRHIGYGETDWDEACAFPGSVNMGKALAQRIAAA